MSDAKKITQKIVDLMTAIDADDVPKAEKIAELEKAVDVVLQLSAIIVPVIVAQVITSLKAIKASTGGKPFLQD